ncbi:MAG: phosphoribosylglycinamide formyltransferase [Ilumatobacter sp.]
MTARLVVLASGSGTNFQAVIDACRSGAIDADIVGLVANRTSAYALDRADGFGIPARIVTRGVAEERAEYDQRLAETVATLDPDWVVLAGWMRLLSMNFLARFPGAVINLHPALPGELPGINAIDRAWTEAQAGKRSYSGVMVHLVPDEGVDDGPVLETRIVPIDASGTREEFASAMHETERHVLVHTLAKLCNEPKAASPAD